MRTNRAQRTQMIQQVTQAYRAMQALGRHYGADFVILADAYYAAEARALNAGVSQERLDAARYEY